jgi:hypothetical protein
MTFVGCLSCAVSWESVRYAFKYKKKTNSKSYPETDLSSPDSSLKLSKGGNVDFLNMFFSNEDIVLCVNEKDLKRKRRGLFGKPTRTVLLNFGWDRV